MRTLLLATALVSACFVQPGPGYGPQPAPQPQPAAQPAPGQPPAQPQRTVWQGRYVCAQGVSSVRLTLDGNCNGVSCSFSALFEFGPVPENPNVQPGSYSQAGEGHANARGELEMSLQPTQWVQRPPSFVMVGMAATADAQQQQLHGRMDNPGCGEVTLARVQ